MNVTCDKCGKRYVISDDKVAGKTSVKIRCKQCQNLISVAVSAPVAAPPQVSPQRTGQQAAAQKAATQGSQGSHASGGVVPQQRSPWEEESTRAMPPLDTTAQWFAMLGGKQQGPFDLGELQRRVAGGEVTLRTYLWKAGMTDWKRAADLAEVSPIFAGVSAPAANPPQPPQRIPTKTMAGGFANPVQRDVAVANEVPSPELTNRPSAQSGAGAVVAKASPSQPGALNDLFGDVSGLHDLPKKSAEPVQEPAGDVAALHASAPVDPFAALSDNDGKEAPPPGEATRFFIAQAGVNKRNPPWKIALFVLAFVVAPLVLIYVLNTFEIVTLPTVTVTNDKGEEVQQSFFSAEGAVGLKDLLTGDAKKKKAEAEKLRLEREAAALAAKAKPNTPAVEEPEVVKPKVQDPNLAAFYEQDDRKTRVPKVRGGGDENAGSTAVNSAGLSPEAVSKVVADKSKAFQTCIDNALRRNPNLSVGNITVILNVGPSGAVKSAGVEPKKHEITEWGQCMMSTGKRIVFPGSDAETQVELPFKVGVAVAP